MSHPPIPPSGVLVHLSDDYFQIGRNAYSATDVACPEHRLIIAAVARCAWLDEVLRLQRELDTASARDEQRRVPFVESERRMVNLALEKAHGMEEAWSSWGRGEKWE